MDKEITLKIIVDENGTVVGAQFLDDLNKSENDDLPTTRLVASGTQRLSTITVPREVIQLSGHYLDMYFSNFVIDERGEIQAPEVKIVSKHEK